MASDAPLEWAASLVAITCSSFRALNLGHQWLSYAVSILSYLVFIAYATKPSQVALNVFYIITSLIGVWRWWSVTKPDEAAIAKRT